MTLAEGESGGTPNAEMGERPGVVQVAMRWWLAQLLLTAYGGYQTWMSPLSGDSCGVGGGSCNFDAFWAAYNAYYPVVLFLLVGAAAGIFLLRNVGRRAILSPIIGIVLLIAWLVTSYALEQDAFNLPFVPR